MIKSRGARLYFIVWFYCCLLVLLGRPSGDRATPAARFSRPPDGKTGPHSESEIMRLQYVPDFNRHARLQRPLHSLQQCNRSNSFLQIRIRRRVVCYAICKILQIILVLSRMMAFAFETEIMFQHMLPGNDLLFAG